MDSVRPGGRCDRQAAYAWERSRRVCCDDSAWNRRRNGRRVDWQSLGDVRAESIGRLFYGCDWLDYPAGNLSSGGWEEERVAAILGAQNERRLVAQTLMSAAPRLILALLLR